MFKYKMSCHEKSRLLENKFKYDMYTSADKPNQQERKVYPQVKFHSL
jgi:hypothetical protein